MPSPESIQAAVAANLVILRQGSDLLAALDHESYTRRIKIAFDAAIGGHMRHIIEHYHALLAALASGVLDYETRPRNRDIEQQPAVAARHLADISSQLESLQAAGSGSVSEIVASLPAIGGLVSQRGAQARHLHQKPKLTHDQAAAPAFTLLYRVETAPGRHSPTSVLRELEFLLSHTVHHYALIALMCRLQNHEPGSAFGVAPSTLRHQQTEAACAR